MDPAFDAAIEIMRAALRALPKEDRLLALEELQQWLARGGADGQAG